MLRSLESISGFKIHARDGEIGHVRDFLFEDSDWNVRYLVVETGNWLASRRVLVSPSAVWQPDWEDRSIPVDLTMEQVRNSPEIDTDQPVSRQQEVALGQHYGWVPYWNPEGYPLAAAAYPVAAEGVLETPQGDPHLRSSHEVGRYMVSASDAELGMADDFIISDTEWSIPYIVVRTGGWFHGQKLLLPTGWVDTISWQQQKITLARSTAEM